MWTNTMHKVVNLKVVSTCGFRKFSSQSSTTADRTNHQLQDSNYYIQWDLTVYNGCYRSSIILAITDRWFLYTVHFCTGLVKLGPEVDIIKRWLLKITMNHTK